MNVSAIFIARSLVEEPVYRPEGTWTPEVKIVVLAEGHVDICTVQGIFGVIRECFERKKAVFVDNASAPGYTPQR